MRRLIVMIVGAAVVAGFLAGPGSALVNVRGGAAFKKAVAACFEKFRTNDPENIIPALEMSKFINDIQETADGVNSEDADVVANRANGRAVGDGGTGKGTSTVIKWNPNNTADYEPGVARDPCGALYHELYHAYEDNKGISVYAKFGADKCAQQVELNATIAQNAYLAAAGLPVRTSYSGQRLCSKTIVNPPMCPPGAVDPKYCSAAKPRPPHLFSPKVKRLLKAGAQTADVRGFLARLFAGGNGLLPMRFQFLSPAQEQFLRLYSFGAGLLSATFKFLAITIDPPAGNFGTVAKPVLGPVPQVRPGAGISPRLAGALNAFARNAALARAVATALSVSINRAAGAALAGADRARALQLAAAAGYARRESRLLTADIRLRGALLPALGRALARAQLDPSALRSLRRRFGHAALPAGLVQELRAAGFTAEVRALRRQLQGQWITAHLEFGALLHTGEFDRAERAGAGALDQLAAILAHG